MRTFGLIKWRCRWFWFIFSQTLIRTDLFCKVLPVSLLPPHVEDQFEFKPACSMAASRPVFNEVIRFYFRAALPFVFAAAGLRVNRTCASFESASAETEAAATRWAPRLILTLNARWPVLIWCSYFEIACLSVCVCVCFLKNVNVFHVAGAGKDFRNSAGFKQKTEKLGS